MIINKLKYIFLYLMLAWLSCPIYSDNLQDLRSFVKNTKSQTKSTLKTSPPPSWRDPFQQITSNDKTVSAVKSNSFSYDAMPTPPTLETSLIHVHYMNAETLIKFLTDKSLHILSPYGHVNLDAKSNLLFLYDTHKSLVHIKQLITQLDAPTHQILIKAQIITVDNTFMKTLGAFFTTKQAQTNTNHKGDLQLDANSANTINIPIVKFRDGSFLDMEIAALENQGHAKLISSPELIAIDQRPAAIESGEEIPYQQSTYSGGTSVTFKKAVLRLKVVPEIMTDQRILLHLTVNQDKVSSLIINGAPAITTQQLETEVLVKNQQTFVLGGIYEQENSNQQTGVPGLKKLPLVGELFQHNKKISNRRELLIFITPKIIN